MTEYQTFKDAIEAADGQKNLLVGNGLSISFDSKFGYSKLFDVASFKDSDSRIADLFEMLNTQDFERVAHALQISSEVSKCFGNNETSKEMISIVEILKNSLISAVNEIHPLDRNSLTDIQCERFRNFVSPFLSCGGKLFSLNYDALIYWGLLRKIDERFRFADGFSKRVNDRQQFEGDACSVDINVLFPHGTLFIFERDGEAYKPRATRPLLEIIKENMNNNYFPLFVSEGNNSQKLTAIRRSFYLNYCFEMIERQHDNFFIHGHSLNTESDGHIFNKIASNKKIRRIFASYFNNKDYVIGQLHMIRNESGRSETDLEIHTYPARTVTCW